MSSRFIVREATADDAEQIVRLVKSLEGEPTLLTEVGEFLVTVEQEKTYLLAASASSTSVFLVAELEKEIIGTLQLRGNERCATRHVVKLGMSVSREWRGQKAGSALLTSAIAWAKSNELIQRIELHAHASNSIAIHLYQKFGFITEGHHLRSIYKNGEYIDSVTMALLLHL